MLRITRQPETERDTLLLEGELSKESIEQEQQALAQARQDGATTDLGLSGHRFIDDEGVCLLSEYRTRGAALLRAAPFVSALLDPCLAGGDAGARDRWLYYG